VSQTTRASILRWQSNSEPSEHTDELATEEPLEIRVAGRPISVTMRTPGHDPELAAGFLLTEGIIHQATDLRSARPLLRRESCNVINAALAPGVAVDFARLTRHVFASSSCGLCGKTTIESVQQQFPPIHEAPPIDARTLLDLPSRLADSQEIFDRTGGLHAAAIFDVAGRLIVLREDVGRHNAVDKAIGYGVLKRLLPFDRHILMVSGRASFEILQKALAARIPCIAAVSAPSSLAVAFAHESGQTLVGFLREKRMNVYAHPSRIHFTKPLG